VTQLTIFVMRVEEGGLLSVAYKPCMPDETAARIIVPNLTQPCENISKIVAWCLKFSTRKPYHIYYPLAFHYLLRGETVSASQHQSGSYSFVACK
jgi:hypothetical protein